MIGPGGCGSLTRKPKLRLNVRDEIRSLKEMGAVSHDLTHIRVVDGGEETAIGGGWVGM